MRGGLEDGFEIEGLADAGADLAEDALALGTGLGFFVGAGAIEGDAELLGEGFDEADIVIQPGGFGLVQLEDADGVAADNDGGKEWG